MEKEQKEEIKLNESYRIYPHAVKAGRLNGENQIKEISLQEIIEIVKNARKHEEYYVYIIQDIDDYYENVNNENYSASTKLASLTDFIGSFLVIGGGLYKIANSHKW